MSSFEKYRIHEVAKDFETTSKVISEILTTYFTAPKNHMQVLEAPELDVIFDYMTQHNQIASIAEVFAVPEPPKAEPAPEAAPAAGEKSAPQTKGQQPAQAPQQAQPQPRKQEQKPHVPRPVAEKRVIDTRGTSATNTNLSKYDEKFDKLAGAHGERQRGGKEKIAGGKNRQKQNMQTSAKRRQEERDKMQKLQLEIAKKQQLKVSIPDEISVGELASRMKKTAAEVIKRLIKLGVFASVSDIIDYDTAALVAMDMNCLVEKEVVVTVEERRRPRRHRRGAGAPRPRRRGHGPRRPRQDQPSGLYPPRQRRLRRGRRHHAAHRRLHG